VAPISGSGRAEEGGARNSTAQAALSPKAPMSRVKWRCASGSRTGAAHLGGEASGRTWPTVGRAWSVVSGWPTTGAPLSLYQEKARKGSRIGRYHVKLLWTDKLHPKA
jgi:hypothetical protein